MWLEECCNLAVLVQLAYTLGALVYLLRVVGIIREQDVAAVLDFEIKATVNAMVCLHAILQFFSCASVELCHSHSSHSVLDIDRNRLAEFHIFHVLDRRYEVELYLAIVDYDVFGMEITLIEAVFVHLYTWLHVLLHLQILVYDECATWLYECGIVAETLKICFLCSVYVEMVGVGCCDYAHPRAQPME